MGNYLGLGRWGIFLGAAVIVGMTCPATLVAENSPSCGFLCGLCRIDDVALERFDEKIVYPNIMTQVWASCEGFNNCCSPQTECQLAMTSKTVYVGSWSVEQGISFGIQLPTGYAQAGSYRITLNGEETLEVEGGVKATCSLGRCQTSSLCVGPTYTIVSRRVPCLKRCYNSNAWPLCGDQYLYDCSGLLQYNKYSGAMYISSQCAVQGTCGLEYTGCPQCVDPSNPNCN